MRTGIHLVTRLLRMVKDKVESVELVGRGMHMVEESIQPEGESGARLGKVCYMKPYQQQHYKSCAKICIIKKMAPLVEADCWDR